MRDLPYFVTLTVSSSLNSNIGYELRNNPFFNQKEFLAKINDLVYSRFRNSEYPLIQSDDIFNLAESTIIESYKSFNESTKSRLDNAFNSERYLVVSSSGKLSTLPSSSLYN